MQKQVRKIEKLKRREPKEAVDDGARYKEIGFMCGLEIHQRLATREKLFCSCPATVAAESDKTIGTISRYQRAVAGELGNIDRSAEFEELRNRKFTYRIRECHTCLVDIDEEPPHGMNHEALGVALSLAGAMDMRILDELQPMRKEVVDGSDPSAFQRTTFVAANGKIMVNGHTINIPSLFLEEESCGIVAGAEDGITYDTDRIGIPLVEIDTDPYIPTPAMAKEVALYIGTLLRISGKVQRGIGSIRQDVNVSIKGGARVEIKGLQEVEKLDRFVENEVARQLKLLEIRDALKNAHASVGEHKDVTKLFEKSTVKVVTTNMQKEGAVFAFKLSGFKGMLGREVNPERRLGTEISDYAKMAHVKGLIHSDENLDAYGFTEKEIHDLRLFLDIKQDDAFIIIAGSRGNAKRAAELAMERAKYALVGVPLETRGVHNTELCTSKFLRPLPGGSRMYPETDARPILLTKEQIDTAIKSVPNIERERKALLSEIENKGLVDQLLLSPRLQLYKTIIESTKADPNFVANTIMQKFTELKRGGFGVEGIDEQRFVDLFAAYSKKQITKQGVEELLKEMALHKESVADLITVKRLHRITGAELEKLVRDLRNEASDPSNVNEIRNIIMSKNRLNVDGSELNALLAKRS